VLESSNHAIMLYSNDCDAQQTELDVDQQKAREKEINRPVNKVPQVMTDCDHNRREDVPVPLDVAETTEGWTRASEFGKYERTRGWSFFMPDLAIDVWRREIHAGQDERLFEYAIVYRGTVGGGGWASNVRVVASLTSMVWDQYHQALRSTRAIANQILTLHSLSDHLKRRANGEKTKIIFTAVGHSLGGGIAQYVHLRVPQISKALAFNPSPVNGASLVPIEERPHVMEEKMKLYPSLDPNAASIFILQEHHEALSLIFPCGGDGPVWGSEGGPVVACHAVDLSHGHPFNQHDMARMARMACKLYLARSQSNTALRP
jgi:hypothetical protein